MQHLWLLVGRLGLHLDERVLALVLLAQHLDRGRHHEQRQQRRGRGDHHVEHGQDAQQQHVRVRRLRVEPRVHDGEADGAEEHLQPDEEEQVARPLAAAPKEALVLRAVHRRRERLVGRRVGLLREQRDGGCLLVKGLRRALEQRVRRRERWLWLRDSIKSCMH